jgi:hypothetical protein
MVVTPGWAMYNGMIKQRIVPHVKAHNSIAPRVR